MLKAFEIIDRSEEWAGNMSKGHRKATERSQWP